MEGFHLIKVKVELQLHKIQMQGFIQFRLNTFAELAPTVFNKTQVFEILSGDLQTVQVVVI